MKALLITVLLLTSASSASARPWVLDAEQWSPTTRLWLARAMIGEAGWLATRDHVGFAYVFLRRWKRLRLRYPELRFVDVVRSYAESLGDGRSEPTPRQRWIRSLDGPLEPDGWPSDKARWSMHVPLWNAALERAQAWAEGRLRDPCRGLAYNFGGAMDVDVAAEKNLREVDCGETESIFYDDGSTP